MPLITLLLTQKKYLQRLLKRKNVLKDFFYISRAIIFIENINNDVKIIEVVILCYVHFTTIKKKWRKENPINNESDLAQNCYVCIFPFKKTSLVENLKDTNILS